MALACLVHGGREQRRSVDAICRAGGSVACDWDRRDGQHIYDGAPIWRERLADIFGIDYFARYVYVRSSNGPTTRELTDIVAIKGTIELWLTNASLKSLRFSDSKSRESVRNIEARLLRRWRFSVNGVEMAAQSHGAPAERLEQ